MPQDNNLAKILLVDDTPGNLDVMLEHLGNHQFNISVALNGYEAIELDQSIVPDIILMDVQMPEMDGYTSVRLMREGGIKIPVYALTAHAMKGAEEECLQAGYSGYMPKPIDIALLFNKLAEELGGRADEAISDKVQDQLVPLLSAEINASQDLATEEHSPKLQIHSSLAGGTNKFEKLINKFIIMLNEKQQ